MAITISNAYIQTFEDNVRHLAQQGETLLRNYVTEINKQSEKHNWDRLAASTARDKTSARMVSPAGGNGSGAVSATDGLAWTRRQTITASFDAGEVIELEDPVQMMINPNAPVTQNLSMAMKRKVDDIIIAAGAGSSRDGDGTAVVYDTTNRQIGSATTVISLDTILAVQEQFAQADVDPDLPKVFVIGPTQQRKLMQLLEVTSSDFQSMKALATGRLPNFMGFDWVVSNRLTSPGAGEIYCQAFTKKAIGLHVSRDIQAEVAQRADMSFAWQFYTVASMAAIRVEDEHMCRVWLKDALT